MLLTKGIKGTNLFRTVFFMPNLIGGIILGYIWQLLLNEDDEIIGYKFVSFGKMMDFIKAGDDANTAFEKAQGQYGRVADAVKIIDPRKE